MASSLDNPAWLEWLTSLMGGGERRSYAATLPPDRFSCLLDELPFHLTPRISLRTLRRRENRGQALYLNPECTVCAAGSLPEEIAERKALLSGFALQGTVAWVRGLSGNLVPFWLGPQLEDAVGRLRPQEPVSPCVSESSQRLLAASNILVPKDRTDAHQEETMSRASSNFRAKGYAPLGDLIHPFHIAALRRYYRYLIRTGAIRLGDGQSPRRYVAYNEPVARFFHHDLASTLSAVAGESLKPSYVYLASYLSGAELKKHTDREQCEFSITLCLDFSPEPELATPWPIRLDTAAGTVTVYQAPGDGLAYRGTRLPHYREPLGKGQTSTSIFFHYVRDDFAGSLD